MSDLFPICLRPDCNKAGTEHVCILPHQEEFLSFKEQYVYWQGGVGGAKTTTAVVDVLLRLLLIPNNRALVIRKDYQDLFDSTWLTFQRCVERAVAKGVIRKPKWGIKEKGTPTRCLFQNGSLAAAAHGKSLGKHLGSEWGVILIDDCMEFDLTILTGGDKPTAGLMSRLRLAQAYYASVGGKVRDFRRFTLVTNPPAGKASWWSLFGENPGVGKFGDGAAWRHFQTSTVANIHLPRDYYHTIAAVRSERDVERVLHGKSLVHFSGKPVLAEFDVVRHVGAFEFSRKIPLLISIDFGFQHPAVVFGQIRKCAYQEDHLIALSEITNVFDATIWQLVEGKQGYPEMDCLLKHLSQRYTDTSRDLIFYCCDRKGNSVSSSNPKGLNDARILADEYNISCYSRGIALDPSLKYMRRLLTTFCKCGYCKLLIDRSCTLLIEAYSGGYRYVQQRGGVYSEKPVEDHYYEDPADAHRYLVENFLSLGSTHFLGSVVTVSHPTDAF